MTEEWEEIGGISIDGSPVHCRVKDKNGVVFPLCGSRVGAMVFSQRGNPNWSWADPSLFIDEPNKCKVCAEHPDLPMLLLGQLP